MLITVTCGGEMERHGYEKGVLHVEDGVMGTRSGMC
jgi:hypothetical protein